MYKCWSWWRSPDVAARVWCVWWTLLRIISALVVGCAPHRAHYKMLFNNNNTTPSARIVCSEQRQEVVSRRHTGLWFYLPPFTSIYYLHMFAFFSWLFAFFFCVRLLCVCVWWAFVSGVLFVVLSSTNDNYDIANNCCESLRNHYAVWMKFLMTILFPTPFYII